MFDGKIKERRLQKCAIALLRYRMGPEASKQALEAELTRRLGGRSISEFSHEEFGRALEYSLHEYHALRERIGFRIFLADVSAEWKAAEQGCRKREKDRERQARKRAQASRPKVSNKARTVASYLDRPRTVSELVDLLETHPTFIGAHGEIMARASRSKSVHRAIDELIRLQMAADSYLPAERGIRQREVILVNSVMRAQAVTRTEHRSASRRQKIVASRKPTRRPKARSA